MSDPFALQRRIHKALVKERPGVAAGMGVALEAIKKAGRAKAWSTLDGFDWEPGAHAFEKWLKRLIKKEPPRKPVRALWIEVPDVLLNRAYTSVSAYEQFDPVDVSFGIDEGRFWPVDDEGATLSSGLHDLPEVERALEQLGWRDDDGDQDERDLLEPGVHALVHAYTTLLVLNHVPAAIPSAWLDGKGIAVLLGWAAGDVEPGGVLSANGWTPIPRPTRKQQATKPEYTDPSSVFFKPAAYAAIGGDPNARDSKGRLVLELQQFADANEIAAIVRLGADVNAADSLGQPVFARYLGDDAESLRVMLEAGADLSRLKKPGAFLRSVEGGGCEPGCLELLLRAGADPMERDGRGNAFHRAGYKACYDRDATRRTAGIIALLSRLGVDVNTKDERGATPLWLALTSMVSELGHVEGWKSGAFLKYRMAGVSYFGHHHKTAIMLLDAGADPNARLGTSPHEYIPGGATPLMVRRYDQPSLFKALLAAGADPMVESGEGRTALDYAREVAASKRSDAAGAATVAGMLERAMKRAASTSGMPKTAAKSPAAKRKPPGDVTKRATRSR